MQDLWRDEGKRDLCVGLSFVSAHLEVLGDAGVLVVLERGEQGGPDDVGLGRPREGGGRSQLEFGNGTDIMQGLNFDLKLTF